MVLVSYILDNHISILQTKFSYGEGHETRRMGLETMPLDQHIEGRHGEREAGVEILPHAVRDPLEMANHGQHGEHRFHQQAVLPLAPRTQFEIARVPLRGMEARVAQDNHPLFKLPDQPLKDIVCDIGRGTLPRHDQPPLIEQETEFPADNPAVVRETFTGNLLRTPAFAPGMDELDALRVDDAEHGRSSQEDLRPVLMGPDKAKEPRPLGEPGKQRAIVARQPARERTVASTFERMQHSQGHYFT